MIEGKRFYQKLWFRLYLFPLLASLFFYREWLAGLKGLFTFLFNLANYIVFFVFLRGRVAPPTAVWASLDSSVRFIFLWTILYIVLYRLSLFILVQFLLPVNNWEDRKKAFNRIKLFARGKHGAAIFIKNGNQIARRSEMDSKKPGVALVDLSSAIVLAQHDNAKTWYLPDEDAPVVKKKRAIKFSLQKKKPPESFYDAKGPGLVFIEKGQKIDSIINLRKQTRTSGEVVVYTRNGIKVKSKVTVVFSLSDDPEILTVGFVGGINPANLKILKTKESGNDLIIENVYDLDFDDAEEILNAINRTPATPDTAGNSISAPYKFDRNRVLRAALSQARNKSGEKILWHEAPLEIATDIFRATLAEIPYDSLFGGSDVYNLDASSKKEKPTSQALLKVKDDFLVKVKLRGMVAFQFVEYLGGFPFNNEQINQKQRISLSSIKKYGPITLMRGKFNFFRDRGIVVKNATFSEILAVEEDIQQRMASNWKAKVENEIAVSSAGYELEAIRVHNRNRALLQEEMTHLLAGVFQATPHFDEALALRVLQALETSVSEMSTEDMQSTDLYEILKNLHDWILFDDSDEPDSSQSKPNSSDKGPRKDGDEHG